MTGVFDNQDIDDFENVSVENCFTRNGEMQLSWVGSSKDRDVLDNIDTFFRERQTVSRSRV